MYLNQIRNELVNYVDKVTEHSIKGNRKGYICPLCRSGTGKNKTGAFSIMENNIKWKCFSCDQSGDVLDLIGFIEGIDDFSTQLKIASELFNIPLDSYYPNNPPHPSLNMKGKKMLENEKQDFMKFYEEANENIHKTDYAHKRGLSDNLIKRFKIGYVEDWRHPSSSENVSRSPRLIIPITKSSYFARDTRMDIPEFQKKYEKMKVGGSNIFNANALKKQSNQPIFVVEGEIDALSIMEVGGIAIGLGGTSNTDLLLKGLEKNNYKKPLLISMDNDSAGKKCQEKLIQSLKKKGISYSIVKLTRGECKDANEMLIKDRQTFSKLVYEASHPKTDKEL